MKADSDVPYGYGFFHFVFATGAMYFGMLFIGWNSHYPIKKYMTCCILEIDFTFRITELKSLCAKVSKSCSKEMQF